MTDSRAQVPRFLRPLFLIVDLGFIAYWAITLAGVVPEEYLFKDYDNPILAAWNWSFLPLDLAISATGLMALRRAKGGLSWRRMARDLDSSLLNIKEALKSRN